MEITKIEKDIKINLSLSVEEFTAISILVGCIVGTSKFRDAASKIFDEIERNGLLQPTTLDLLHGFNETSIRCNDKTDEVFDKIVERVIAKINE